MGKNKEAIMEKRRAGKKRRRGLGVFLLLALLLLGGVCAAAGQSPYGLYQELLERWAGSLYNTIHPAPEEDGLLILVNPWHPLPEDYDPELVLLSDGQKIAACCYEDFAAMLNDCRAAGNSPILCSAYRTQEVQQSLYDDKVSRLMAAGCDLDSAKTEAARAVAYPGTSEHQTGLAVDIIDAAYTALDEGQENTATQQWLMANSWQYGFILRYPAGKSDITGIIYEPWHYRYVGKAAAADIYDSGLCLEEYLEKQ